MHYSDQYVLENNEVSFVFYHHDYSDYPSITSIRSVFLLTPYQLDTVLNSFIYTKPIEFKPETFYFVKLKLTDSHKPDQFNILQVQEITEDHHESFFLH